MSQGAEDVLKALLYRPDMGTEDVRMITRSGRGAQGELQDKRGAWWIVEVRPA